jgi:hypothetical protein
MQAMMNNTAQNDHSSNRHSSPLDKAALSRQGCAWHTLDTEGVLKPQRAGITRRREACPYAEDSDDSQKLVKVQNVHITPHLFVGAA